MAKIHNIKQSLEREVQGQPRSERFYSEVLNATSIRRIGYETPEEIELQRQDIDLFATIDGEEISISEKDRDRDFDDLLIEFYSVYPDSRGWMDNSEAQMMAYYTPTKVIWVNKHQLVEFYNNHLRDLPVESHFDKLYKTGGTFSQGYLKILGKDEKISFIAAPNPGYVTMSIAVSFDLLRRAGVDFTITNFV
ncbi:MAG: hypothetical protein ACYC25_14670 [Paludibacter sp.]